ncbi:MAG: hypothetical protein WCO00_17065, partial [Rhodospirillaceae bacterium]
MGQRPRLATLFTGIAAFFAGSGAALRAGLSSAPILSSRPQPPTDDPAVQYEKRIADAVSERGSVVGGRMHLVNLSKIAEIFGPRWSKLVFAQVPRRGYAANGNGV